MKNDLHAGLKVIEQLLRGNKKFETTFFLCIPSVCKVIFGQLHHLNFTEGIIANVSCVILLFVASVAFSSPLLGASARCDVSVAIY